MKKLLATAGALPCACLLLLAQATNPTTSGTQTSGTQSQASAQAGTASGTQTWSGRLIDAGCSDVAALRNTAAAHTSAAMSNSGTAQMPTTTQSATSAAQTGATGTSSTAARSGSPDPIHEVDSTRSRTTAGNRTAAQSSRTESNRSATGETASAGSQSQSSTTLDRSSASTATSETGDRNRTASSSTASTAASAGMHTAGNMPDLQKCAVTSATNRFAIWSNGQVYFFDEASNTQIQQKMQSDAQLRQNMTAGAAAHASPVHVTGTMSGHEIKLSSIRAQ